MQRTQLATGAIRKQSFVGTSLVASNEVDETPNFKPDPFSHVILSRNGKSHDDAKGDTLYNRTIQAYWPLYEQAGHNKEKRSVIEQCIATMRRNGVVFVRWYRNAYTVEPRDRVEQASIYSRVTRRLRSEVRVRTLSLTDEEKLLREAVFRKARKAKRNLEKFQQNEFDHRTASSVHSDLLADLTVLPEVIQHHGSRTTCHEGKKHKVLH